MTEEEKWNTINQIEKEIHKELKDIDDYSWYCGNEIAFAIAIKFIEMYKDEGINKILEVLNIQLKGVKIFKDGCRKEQQ